MTTEEFAGLHEEGVAAMRAYFLEAEKTSDMLAGCTSDPLPLTERLGLVAQEITEKEAHSLYLGIKRLLHDLARSGYGNSG